MEDRAGGTQPGPTRNAKNPVRAKARGSGAGEGRAYPSSGAGKFTACPASPGGEDRFLVFS